MSKRYGDWRDEAQSQLQAFISEQSQQRTQLELTLETTPRDSRYSANLVSLMKAEEDNAGKEKLVAAELNRKVDEALSLETHKFFERTATQNIKRWKALSQKLEHDREKYRAQLNDQLMKIAATSSVAAAVGLDNGNNGNNGISGSSSSVASSSKGKKVLTAEDLDEESLRLEEDYSKSFLQYEGFNLSEAFKSHKLKVDKDWSTHELLLDDDYKARRFLITGTEEAKTVTLAQVDDQENRWQHPEKQKTLIHTAPVLAPVLTVVNGASAGSAIRAVRGRGREDANKNAKELERLDRQYTVALDSLAEQKNGAMRWMARQKIRLMSQTEETKVERAVMGLIIEKERKDIKMIKDTMSNFITQQERLMSVR